MPSSPSARRRRRLPLAAVAAALLASMTACDSDISLGSGPDQPVETLVASPAWVRTAQGGAQPRLASLQRALDALRAETGSGWVGRQDDRTGYLASLSGGRYAVPGADRATAVVQSMFDDYGPALFGVGYDDLRLDRDSTATIGDSRTLRAEQVVGDVPVLDGELAVTIGDPEGEPRVNAVRGRVFEGLSVDTRPTVTARRATAIARELSGAQPQGRPELVVVPEGDGVLAWQLTVLGRTSDDGALADGIYFIDAHRGRLVALRPASIEGELAFGLDRVRTGPSLRELTARGPSAEAAPAAESAGVQVSGSHPLTGQLVANGVQTGAGIRLLDTTVPTWDPTTGNGGIETLDATGLTDENQLPGRPFAFSSAEVPDGDAMAAHVYARAVYDFYAALGWASWDGRGGSLLGSVHFGGPSFCNAMFLGGSIGQMVYGDTCVVDGEPQANAGFSIDTAGHEITHGVINSSAGLVYQGQSGAMNESFADYFGNVIGNLFTGDDSDGYSEHRCAGVTPPTLMCNQNPDGSVSLRFLPNGHGMDDYARLLSAGYRYRSLGLDQDHGGVHSNSAVWNNALWTIRKRLAQLDGTPGNESPLAQDFDKIVFHVLTTQLHPTAEFVDARAAIEQTIVDAGADPVISRVAREVFDANQICTDCLDLGAVPGRVLSALPSTEVEPVVSGDRVAWLDLGAHGVLGRAMVAPVGGTPTDAGLGERLVFLAWAGDALVGYDDQNTLRRLGPDGTVTTVGRDDAGASHDTGIAGSAEGAAWLSGTEVHHVDAQGAVTSTPLPDLADDRVITLATGGGQVVLGTVRGQVLSWRPGGQVEQIGSMPRPVVSLAVAGGRVLVVDVDGTATLVGGQGESVTLSTQAAPLGVALSDTYAVWPEAEGALAGGVNEASGEEYPETNLYLYSFETGRTYDVMPVSGQQGFPALAGDHLVWQDAVYGDNDLLTGRLPAGL